MVLVRYQASRRWCGQYASANFSDVSSKYSFQYVVGIRSLEEGAAIGAVAAR
jgi:hypothetical protein